MESEPPTPPKEDEGDPKIEDNASKKEDKKEGGEKEKKSDSVVYNIHLSLPGVSQAVDVLVSYMVIFYGF